MKSEIIAMSQPTVDKAVDEYMHRNEPVYFHKRFPEGQCPFCPTAMEKMREQLAASLDIDDLRDQIVAVMEDE